MQSDENAGKPQGILSPECSSGGKERKLLSVFWLGLIQVVFKKYMKAISSNMNINEKKNGMPYNIFTIFLTDNFQKLNAYLASYKSKFPDFMSNSKFTDFPDLEEIKFSLTCVNPALGTMLGPLLFIILMNVQCLPPGILVCCSVVIGMYMFIVSKALLISKV